MSEEARWEGIHPDSLFSRSIEQVMRDWGLVRTSGIPSDPPTATVPNKTAEGLDEEDRLSCRHCDDLFRATGISPSTPLPARDCYGGTGIGVWLDDFLDQGYAPEVDRNDVNAKLDYMENHWKYWRDLGVRKVVTSYLSSTERDPILQRLLRVFSLVKPEIIDTMSPQHEGGQRAGASIPFLRYTPGTDNPPTPPDFEFAPPLGPHEMDWIVRTSHEQNFHFDELYDAMLANPNMIREYLIFLRVIPLDASLDEALTVWVTYRTQFVNIVSTYIANMLDASDGINAILRSIYLSTYDIQLIETIVSQHVMSIREGRLVLSPDLYYSVFPYSDISRYYLEISRVFDAYGLQDQKRHIQPYIELKCDPCTGRPAANSPCSPVRVVCDMLLMGLLGFGGPIFYTSGGVDQRYWEAAIVGSWLMGCLPGVSPPVRFRTVGEAIRFACSLFPEPDTAHAAKNRQAVLGKYDVFRGNGEVVQGAKVPGSIYNNPMTCRTCCKGVRDGRPVRCQVKASNRTVFCRGTTRCCDGPLLSCNDPVFSGRSVFCPMVHPPY